MGTFVSRNNDIGGYWSLGKLHGHGLQDAGQLGIDLLSQRTFPESDAFPTWHNDIRPAGGAMPGAQSSDVLDNESNH
ncbi:MAG: hypothetical protein V9G12_12060 [Microthrixaceae bacterium]